MIAGTGSNSTDEAVELSQYAEKAGSDALLVVTPYYNKPTQEGLYQHYKKINDSVGIPIIIYNIPSRSVIDMSVDTMSKLYELKNIAAKISSDFQKACEQRNEEAEKLDKLLQPLHSALFIESNPSPVKYAASLLGMCNPSVRLPLVEIREETKKKVSEALKVAKLL